MTETAEKVLKCFSMGDLGKLCRTKNKDLRRQSGLFQLSLALVVRYSDHTRGGDLNRIGARRCKPFHFRGCLACEMKRKGRNHGNVTERIRRRWPWHG